MINFMKFKNWYFGLSLLIIVPGIISLLVYGLKPSIDFTGGSILEIVLHDQSPQIDDVRGAIVEKTELVSLVPAGNNQYILKLKPIDRNEAQSIKMHLQEKFGAVEELRFETVGPSIGKELLRKTFTAIILAASIILVFVMKQFSELKYGICAIIAMFHDTLILLGSFSLLGHFYGVEVDTLFVTAVLTILSFSIHDTIVVYDRIRETSRKNRKASFSDIVNTSVADTLSRSINNSMTIIFMLLALWLLGGESIKWFVLALLIGTVTGTYSSTFTAAPLLLLWEDIKNRKR